MLSERDGPVVAAPGSCVPGGRWSDPSTRMVLPVTRLPPPDRALSALLGMPGAVCALTMKMTIESRIQLPIAIAPHLRMRRRSERRAPGAPGGTAPRRRLRSRSMGVCPGRRSRSARRGRER